MKYRIAIVFAFVSVFAQLWAKPEIKLPDTYAFTRVFSADNTDKTRW